MESVSQILTKEDCYAKLNEFGVEYKVYDHPAVMNVPEMIEHMKLDKSPFVKNLLFASKKGELYLIMAEASLVIGKGFWKELNQSHNNVRLAKPEILDEVLKTQLGRVNPFSLMNDTESRITKVVLDKSLVAGGWLAFHPADNTASVELDYENFAKFLTGAGKTCTELDLTVELPPAEPKAKADTGKKGGNAAKKGGKGGNKKDEAIAENADEKMELGISVKKSEDFPKWYIETIHKGDMIDNYDISGCYVIRPNAYFIWEQMQAHMNKSFRKLGVQNCYFPMFVKKSNLEKEASHVEGFCAEVAWITKGGKTELPEPIAIRPTSETIINPSIAKRVQGWRDLPIRLNQWSNVVRWEFKHPTPFIRTREFLWQEGHTAHSTVGEADKMTLDIMEAYRSAYEDVMSIPVTMGKKSEDEKFPGADWTGCLESYVVETGRSIQAATSHYLGQNFSKMFGIEFENKENKKEFAYQTSWGLSTRSIGAFVMIHGDDKGMVMTPTSAEFQVVIVPIYMKSISKEDMNARARVIAKQLEAEDIRVTVDDRENYTAGFRYNYWEIRGTPFRLELGPKDIAKNQVTCVTRFDGFKKEVAIDSLVQSLKGDFESVKKAMFKKSLDLQESRKRVVTTWEDFMVQLNLKFRCLAPWCNVKQCELDVKKKSADQSRELQDSDILTGAAKTLCLPFEQPPLDDHVCFHCGKKAEVWAIWGRSY
jgi:prolyl-tRNA synthetase